MFNKIRNMFERIFRKQVLLEESIKENKKIEQNINFRKELIESSNVEVINLQKQYENGEILEEDLPKYKINKLIKLYKEQIKELNDEINNKKLKVQ